jgi:hypothetical protein
MFSSRVAGGAGRAEGSEAARGRRSPPTPDGSAPPAGGFWRQAREAFVDRRPTHVEESGGWLAVCPAGELAPAGHTATVGAGRRDVCRRRAASSGLSVGVLRRVWLAGLRLVRRAVWRPASHLSSGLRHARRRAPPGAHQQPARLAGRRQFAGADWRVWLAGTERGIVGHRGGGLAVCARSIRRRRRRRQRPAGGGVPGLTARVGARASTCGRSLASGSVSARRVWPRGAKVLRADPGGSGR